MTLVRAKVATKLARRRRWLSVGGGVAALVLLVVVIVAATDDGDDEPSVLAADTSGSPVSSSTTATEMSSTSEAGPPEDAVAPPASAPTTAAPATPPATAAAAPATCDPGQVRFGASRSTVAVRPGEPVMFTVTAVNEAGRDCAEAATSVLSVTDASGREVANRSSSAASAPGAPPWRSGEARSEEVQWESRTLDGEPLPPGRYTATVTWHATDDAGTRAEYRTMVDVEVRD